MNEKIIIHIILYKLVKKTLGMCILTKYNNLNFSLLNQTI